MPLATRAFRRRALALAGTPLSIGNKAPLVQDGAQTNAAMLATIRAARSSVHLEMYIFEGGAVGDEFARALAERRRAGVEVRVAASHLVTLEEWKERPFTDRIRQAARAWARLL